MSTELLGSALNALRRLAEKAGTHLVEVRLVVQDHAGAEQLANVVLPEGEDASGILGDVISSQDAIRMWETGTELAQPRELGGNLDGVRWQIDWQRPGGPQS